MSSDTNAELAPQPITVDVLREKYAAPGEVDADAVRRRIARALAAAEARPADWEPRFFAAQRQGFIPAGRIAAAAGRTLDATLINCFVQPVGDSIGGVEGGLPGIYPALEQAAQTLRRGGGVGFDFSALRPSGAPAHGTGGRASGPVSFMRLFDCSCATIESAGARRGAQMGMLRVDHPDIEAFIHAKDRPGELTNFNLSVAADDAFLQAVVDDGLIDLVHRVEPGPVRGTEVRRRADGLWVYRSVPARGLFDAITERSWRHGDPGMVFIDTLNRENNLRAIEQIVATNPCAEQPLPAYGCCCLGSIDLTRFVREPFTAGARLELEAIAALVPVAVRMLDDVLTVTRWPLQEQAAEAAAKRRIGLGLTGLGDALIMLGQRYDSESARETVVAIAVRLRDAAYAASVELAREKGAFPHCDPEALLATPFVGRLPQSLRDSIGRHGLRNSHLLSIAPTGTISLAFADNVSSGIEPAYAWAYRRNRRLADGSTRSYRVEDHAHRLYRARFGPDRPLTDAFVSALEIGPRAHMAMVAALTPYIDAGISKTINVPADEPLSAFRDLYLDAWRLGLKALSTFRPSSGRASVLSAGTGPDELEQASETSAAEATASASAHADGAMGAAPQSRGDAANGGALCPICGSAGVTRVGGCLHCPSCGFDAVCG
jgi:ribonucleoside-diphosphate reductase alpha chain